jgi:hypothetical protein
MVNGRICDRIRWHGGKALKQRIQIQPTYPMDLIQASGKEPSGQIALDALISRMNKKLQLRFWLSDLSGGRNAHIEQIRLAKTQASASGPFGIAFNFG